jgi:hypothetical protein
MACSGETYVASWMTLVAISTSVTFVPAGDWFDAAQLTTGKSYGEVADRNGNVQGVPVAQLTNDPRNPGSGITVALQTNAIAANGVFDPDQDHAISSGAYKYARIGWNVSLTTGSTLATMTAMFVAQLARGT